MATGIKVWDATRTCADVHPHGPIPKGSHLKCEFCSQTGIESHPCLKTDALDRKGSRLWPDPEMPRSCLPDANGLVGGTGKKLAKDKPARVTARDMRWLDQHRCGLSIPVMANQDAVSRLAVHEGIVRALFAEKALKDAEAKKDEQRDAA